MKDMMTLQVKFLRTDWEKTKGLVGAKTIYPVTFTTRWGIHTFGVLSPIDVLILDDNNKVMTCIKNLTPNRLFFWNPKYEIIVELPAGTIARKHIAIGDQLSLKAKAV